MKAKLVACAVSVALAFVAVAVLADDATASMGNLGEKIARAAKAAVADAVREAERAAAAAEAEAPDPAPGEAVLSLKGTEGVGFSGACAVGDEEREISGQVPRSYTFDLVDGIECEIQKQDPEGSLKVLFAADGDRVVQRMTGGEGTVRIVHRNGGVSCWTTSSSGTTNQIISNHSSASVVSSSISVAQ